MTYMEWIESFCFPVEIEVVNTDDDIIYSGDIRKAPRIYEGLVIEEQYTKRNEDGSGVFGAIVREV